MTFSIPTENQFYLKFASCLVSQVDLNLYQWIKHAFDEVHLRFNLFFFQTINVVKATEKIYRQTFYIALPDDELTLSQFKNHFVPIDWWDIYLITIIN